MDLATGAVTASVADRLSSTLFLAALAHGVVILGVTFASDPFGKPDELPALNVTLLVDTQTTDRVDPDTDLLANRNAHGGGNPDDAFRPTTTLAADHPLTQQGDPLGADLTDGTPRDAAPEAEQLATSHAADRKLEAVPEATDSPSAVPMRAAQLIRQTAPNTLAAEIDDEVRSQRSDEVSDSLNPTTREAVLANYLVGWRRRVERIGTANFPKDFVLGRSVDGRPVLEVAIGREGMLEDIVVRRSSGDKTLDDAALEILRLAAPFEPLPAEILAEYDVLRFAYEWDFTGRGDRPRVAAGND